MMPGDLEIGRESSQTRQERMPISFAYSLYSLAPSWKPVTEWDLLQAWCSFLLCLRQRSECHRNLHKHDDPARHAPVRRARSHLLNTAMSFPI